MNHIKGEFMRKVVLKRGMVSFFVGASALFSSGNAVDQTTTSVNSQVSAKDNQCSKETLHAYFPESFLRETFAKFNVPKDKWDTIIKNLNEKDKNVIKIVEEKTAKMNPNPLKDPQQRQVVVKLLRETLLEVFSNELKANGVTDDKQISAMLDDIQQQKVKRIAECIKNEAQTTKSFNSSADDSDDDEDDDEDEDDEDEEDDLEEDEVNSTGVQNKP